MSGHLVDSLATTDALARVFADESMVQAMLDFESALAVAQAKLGVIPRSAAEAIAASARAAHFDAARLAREAREYATVAIPLVRALRSHVRAVDDDSSRFVHWGATSQDVADSALILALKQARPILAADHQRLDAALTKLSAEHASTVMLGADAVAAGVADHLRSEGRALGRGAAARLGPRRARVPRAR